MLFREKLKQLRMENQLPQRKLASVIDIDTATYCKIERGERQLRREQIAVLAEVFKVDTRDLLTLWLADKVYNVVAEEEDPNSVLNMVCDNIDEYKRADKRKG